MRGIRKFKYTVEARTPNETVNCKDKCLSPDIQIR